MNIFTSYIVLFRREIWNHVPRYVQSHSYEHMSPSHCGTEQWEFRTADRVELIEVIAMAADGRIQAEMSEFSLEQAVEAYDKLKAGQITGRAVLIPDGA